MRTRPVAMKEHGVTQATATVRGRCRCGRRYRIRNLTGPTHVACPQCGRAISVTEADLQLAGGDLFFTAAPVEFDDAPRDAVIIDRGLLRIAKAGSRPGVTGRDVLDSPDAMVARALRGGLGLGLPHGDPARGETVFVEVEQRPFLHDLAASFYFAGSRHNAITVGLYAVGCSVLVAVFYPLALLGPLVLLTVPLFVATAIFLMQFYWTTLERTAGGEEEIPAFQSGFDIWEDAIRPFFVLLAISVFCSIPLGAWAMLAPPGLREDSLLRLIALGAGWFFWPVAVMSVAIGRRFLFLRPDWLVRCVAAIGPVYIVAWVAVIVSVAGWIFAVSLIDYWFWIPAVGFAINMYFGYVLFRTLGLLYRHFQQRFPWKY